MREKVIAGNWKMNKTIVESVEFIQDLKQENLPADREIIICAPYTSLYTLSGQIQGTNIKLASQNIHFEDSGAFTGEISPLMLLGTEVEYVVVGHSERRQYFGESDDIVNKKALTCLNHGLKPIICVGEVLEQREAGITMDVIKTQVIGSLKNIPNAEMSKLIIAYEPVWAIGTGKTATSEDANEVCGFIRKTVEDLHGETIAQNTIILYGGSVKSDNANSLFTMEHIDGGLVGGASLKANEFAKIINYEG